MGQPRELGTRRASRRSTRSDDVFAEARPERVLIEEEYRYFQEISANRWTEPDGAPSGRVEVRVPYDGVRHVPASTVRALDRRLGDSTDECEATIGHVVLSDLQHSGLVDHPAFGRSHGSIPVRLPVRSSSLTDSDALSADRHEHRWELDYSPDPDHPELIPIALEAKIEDTDTSGLRDIISEHDGGQADSEFVSAMTRYIAFRPALTLVLTAVVTVTLPRQRVIRPPVVRRISVGIPALASLDGGKLGLTVVDGTRVVHELDVHYDAERERVEWFDVPLRAWSSADATSAASSDQIVRKSFRTNEMRLDIDQPGDLFNREEVEIRAEVEMPDFLLSGMQARLFDARGRWSRAPRVAAVASRRAPAPARAAEPAFTGRPKKEPQHATQRAAVGPPTRAPGPEPVTQRTVLRTRCTVSLHDAFAQHPFRPHQSLHFDEIIPDQDRVADVEAVLKSLGFTTTESTTPDWDGRDPDELLWALEAERGDQVSGDNAAKIWIVIRGRRHLTRRQSERGAGTKYTTRVPTGELELFVRGTTSGNSRTLMEQMNALHRLLKERFRPMRSQR